MVGPYPAAAALRRRAARMEANGEAFPVPPVNDEAQGDMNRQREARQQPRRTPPQRQPPNLSTLYFLLSLSLAMLAIITSSSSSSSSLNHASQHHLVEESSPSSVSSLDTNEQQQQPAKSTLQQDFVKSWNSLFSDNEKQDSSTSNNNSNNNGRSPSIPPLFRWMLPPVKQQQRDSSLSDKKHKRGNANLIVRLLSSMIDPTLLHPQPSTPTDVIDKILTSTPRLLAIANLLLAITYLLHSLVATLFLGTHSATGRRTRRGTNNAGGNLAWQQETTTNFSNNPNGNTASSSWVGRERLGGFLIFKLLLISAVVAPDTLDLLILLSWYTLLAFLRSLAQLCSSTTAHAAASGTPPQRGVVYLLLSVLTIDVLAAALCVALFHGAGWGMVLLLTSDCALLALNVLSYALQHLTLVLEDRHSNTIRQLEERQVDVHAMVQQAFQQQAYRQRPPHVGTNASTTTGQEARNDQAMSGDDDVYDHDDYSSYLEEEDDVVEATDRIAMLQQESRQLDRRVERHEANHGRQVQILDSVIFGLQLIVQLLTVVHFLHIWTLHGLQFTLIDGVLALHLHSALSAAFGKIAERRNLHKIARDLDGLFEDASEVDMRKADNVCCICLVPMTTGRVKRVGCGHLYHTHCLREVVERARSIEAAKCPLCRASLLDGRQGGGIGVAANATAGNANGQQQQQPRGGDGRGDATVAGGRPPSPPAGTGAAAGQAAPAPGEHALFRFSTENILPAWLPLPAFSFEVVRRPPIAVDAAAANNNAAQEAAGDRNNNNVQPSFLRRLLIMAGAIPMSQEEVAMYLDQLVDMFPQYDRADLLRELRMRGSSEAVVEAVLMGVFTGVPREGAVGGGNVNLAVEAAAPGQDEQRASDDVNDDGDGIDYGNDTDEEEEHDDHDDQ